MCACVYCLLSCVRCCVCFPFCVYVCVCVFKIALLCVFLVCVVLIVCVVDLFCFGSVLLSLFDRLAICSLCFVVVALCVRFM